MEDKDLRFEMIHPEMKDFDKIKKLYYDAFPPGERVYTADDAFKKVCEGGEAEAYAVYDSDTLVGFYALDNHKDYKYLQFLAMYPAVRNKGYGGSIVRKWLKDNQDCIIFGSIEKPVEGEEGYDLKKRRRQFYERNGMIIVDRSDNIGGVEMIPITNKTGEKFDQYYAKEVDALQKLYIETSK